MLSPPISNTETTLTKPRTRRTKEKVEHFALDKKGRGKRVSYNERGMAQVVEETYSDGCVILLAMMTMNKRT